MYRNIINPLVLQPVDRALKYSDMINVSLYFSSSNSNLNHNRDCEHKFLKILQPTQTMYQLKEKLAAKIVQKSVWTP